MKIKLLIMGAAVSLAAILTRAQITNAPDAISVPIAVSPKYETVHLNTNQLNALLADIGETNADASNVRVIYIRKAAPARNVVATVRVTYMASH